MSKQHGASKSLDAIALFCMIPTGYQPDFCMRTHMTGRVSLPGMKVFVGHGSHEQKSCCAGEWCSHHHCFCVLATRATGINWSINSKIKVGLCQHRPLRLLFHAFSAGTCPPLHNEKMHRNAQNERFPQLAMLATEGSDCAFPVSKVSHRKLVVLEDPAPLPFLCCRLSVLLPEGEFGV
jgi:hypothetical protein